MPPRRFVHLQLAAAAAVIGVLIPVAWAAPDGTTWRPPEFASSARVTLKLPSEPSVSFRGQVNLDDAGSKAGAAMLYPAPSLLGGLVAVFTHGAIVESTKSAEKVRLQNTADQVLEPHKDVLAGFLASDLVRDGIERLGRQPGARRIDQEDPAAADWVVDGVPVFTMLQDRRALVLDHAVTVFAAAEPSAPKFSGLIRVVSAPIDAEDPQQFWNADAGRRLKEASAALYAHSLELLFASKSAGATEVSRTVRFLEGRVERFERGILLQQRCQRVVLTNLRGWLMSVPSVRRAADASADCVDPLALAPG